MVSKANRYESIETENHRHESKKHAEKAEKIRVSTGTPMDVDSGEPANPSPSVIMRAVSAVNGTD